MSKIHYRTCNLCEAMCGLEIHYQNTDIVAIKGDAADPLSRGHICPKATALQDLHNDPDRLKQPLRKTPDGWKTIDWEEALDIVADRFGHLQQQYGKNSVGVYVGNPSVHNHNTSLTLLPFLKALGTKKRFSATSNDQLPHMLASLEMFGHQILFPVPDIDHTDLFILFGSNPIASNGSLMTAPGFRQRIEALQQRGGKFILLDPRRTETARVADEHHFVRPGSDVLVLLGMLHVLVTENRINAGRLEPYVNGLDLLPTIIQDFAPEKVSRHTGLSAATIRKLARSLSDTPRALLFGRMGTSTQEFGGLATWLIYVLNIITGHLDQRGGLMFTLPAVDLVELASLSGQQGHVDRYRSQHRQLPEFGGELPASTMADEILGGGPDSIKAMLVLSGNPILSSPNGQRLEEAFSQLEFMVSIDFYLNETSQFADIILPPTGPLEHSHYDLIFNLLTVRNVAKYSPALFEPEADTRHDWQILTALGNRLASKHWKSRLTTKASALFWQFANPDHILDLLLRTGPYGQQPAITRVAGEWAGELVQDFLPPSNLLRKLILLGPYNSRYRSLQKGLSLDVLKEQVHGIDLGALQPAIPERLYHKDQKIHLTPQRYLDDLPRAAALLKRRKNQKLLLIGRRDVRSNNSWLHNSHRLVKGNHRCTLIMHPDDAQSRHIQNKEIIQVRSRVGSVEVPVELSSDIMPGVVSLPHGWGHHRKGTRLSIASERPGVSINDLTDEYRVDPISGTSALNGTPVEVKRLNT